MEVFHNNLRNLNEAEPTNELKKSGAVNNDPHFIVDIYDMVYICKGKGEAHYGEKLVESFGTNEMADDILDYAFHRAMGVTLQHNIDFFKNNHVFAVIHVFNGDKSINKRLIAYKIGTTWRVINIT